MNKQYEKHTTHTDALDTLGFILEGDEKRDAIHLAVEPVEAAEELFPGDHVSFDNVGRAVKVEVGDGVGIVDPFLNDVVEPGQKFWLVVYPRQITSLRHVWEHESFPPSGGKSKVSANVQNASELWLKNWLANNMSSFFSLDNLIEAIETGSWEDPTNKDDGISYNGVYITSHGWDASGTIPPEFWDHYTLYTGNTVADVNKATYLGCSC